VLDNFHWQPLNLDGPDVEVVEGELAATSGCTTPCAGRDSHHLGAPGSVPRLGPGSADLERRQRRGTLNVLLSPRDEECVASSFVSTSVYGSSRQLPTSEE
jgi:hypothetical protein